MKSISKYIFKISSDTIKKQKEILTKITLLKSLVKNSSFQISYSYIILLKEILASNMIENIHTTYLELLEFSIDLNNVDQDTKKVFYNIDAFEQGLMYLKNNLFLDKKIFIKIKKIISKNNEEIRNIPGTVIKGENNQVVYKPPQTYEEIVFYLNDLEIYLNDEKSDIEIGYLAKMALCHFQFESIHPFSDCNGRTSRIINTLFLILKKIIEIPIIPLSYYIYKTKDEYYQKLNDANLNDEKIVDFILYMISIVKKSSQYGIILLEKIKLTYDLNWKKVKVILPKIKYEEFLKLFNQIIFDYNFFMNTFGVSRNTAVDYINKLIDNQIVIKNKTKKTSFMIKDIILEILNKEE